MKLRVFDYAQWEKQIIPVPISEDLLERAKEALKQQPKYKSTKELNRYRDLYGYIGQFGVIEWIADLVFTPDHEEYFTEDKKGDECDFVWRYEKCDVKASPTSKGYPKVYPKSRLLVKDDTKKVDRLVFVKVNVSDRMMYIAGTISWQKFWGVPEEYLEGRAKPFESKKVKHPCHYILAKDLSDFKKWVQA